MRAGWTISVALGALVALAGCGGGDGEDAGGPGVDAGRPPGVDAGPMLGMDAGPMVGMDGGPLADAGPGDDGSLPGDDGGTTGDGAIPMDGAAAEDGGLPEWDSGPPEACPTPGALETIACGRCGEVDRFCTASGTWAYGSCTGQGGCEPGTTGTIACGDCGSQPARCTSECVWETTGDCSGEGECAPGSRSRSGSGCTAGETREVLCNDVCAYEPTGVCEADGCPTPGALEEVDCGMCGTQERFCNSSRVWEYGVCTSEGACTPGTTEPMACGMCGTRMRRCLSDCRWDETADCTGEGTCEPGAVVRTSAGCPSGQTKPLLCDDSCAYTETGACEAVTAVDVTVLLDLTGSHGTRVSDGLTTLEDDLIAPLLALGDVAVGVSYYAEFPGTITFPFFDAGIGGLDGPGDPGDRPFHGGIEPTTSASALATELGTLPAYGGGDSPESGVEALYILTGGTPVDSALPLTCSSGRATGGCWRSGARRIVVIYTDAPIHNGPDPASSGIYAPYDVFLGAASWSSTLARLTSDGTAVIFMHHDSGTMASGEAGAQFDEMLDDLGQPSTDRIAAETSLSTACGQVVARVQALTGL